MIDSKSFSLEDLIGCQPFLIKPNRDELEELPEADAEEQE